MSRPYQVAVQRQLTETFEVDANSPEEAESIVEQWIDEGEAGAVETQSFEVVEVLPVDIADDTAEAIPDATGNSEDIEF